MYISDALKPPGCRAEPIDYVGPLTDTVPEGEVAVLGCRLRLICGDRNLDFSLADSPRYTNPNNNSLRSLAIAALEGFCINCPNQVVQERLPAPAVTTPEVQPIYNPLLVTMAPDKSGYEEVPIITRHNLRNFAKEIDGITNRGQRLANRLLDPRGEDREFVLPYLYMSRMQHPLGVRAERAQDLLVLFNEKRVHLRGMAGNTINFFAKVCDSLYISKDLPEGRLDGDNLG